MIKQIIGFTILCIVLFGCKREREIYVKYMIVYRDTCDSDFIRKIGQIETGNNDSLSGENGAGRGRFGIYNICVKGSGLMDCLGFTHNDMHNSEQAKSVFWAMMGIFCHTYYQKHSRYPSYEDLARMWSGGPNGYNKNSTLKYLEGFKK